jgi:hypothetical protein
VRVRGGSGSEGRAANSRINLAEWRRGEPGKCDSFFGEKMTASSGQKCSVQMEIVGTFSSERVRDSERE